MKISLAKYSDLSICWALAAPKAYFSPFWWISWVLALSLLSTLVGFDPRFELSICLTASGLAAL
uniref:Uncharacterized protein n=1 Tax=Romanomermis culicivorax TaxID=13658 RepID=A0A915JVC5_ROMCU